MGYTIPTTIGYDGTVLLSLSPPSRIKLLWLFILISIFPPYNNLYSINPFSFVEHCVFLSLSVYFFCFRNAVRGNAVCSQVNTYQIKRCIVLLRLNDAHGFIKINWIVFFVRLFAYSFGSMKMRSSNKKNENQYAFHSSNQRRRLQFDFSWLHSSHFNRVDNISLLSIQ